MERLQWGLTSSVPEDAIAAWGARAIDDRGRFDLVPDRQDAVGEDEPRKALLDYLNEHLPVRKPGAGMDAAVMHLPQEYGDHTIHRVWERDGVTVLVRRAGGYFYAVAWMVAS